MIRTAQLSFAAGEFRLREISLEIERGEYFILLGPTGSGKTLFLECLCGLKRLDAGRIYIGGREVTGLEPRERGIGYLPQDLGLFPHLSVERNVRFGLRARGVGRRKAKERSAEVARLFGTAHLARRRIGALSGGEKQRVALARALAVEPQVLLLDEPLSALDEATRVLVARDLKKAHELLGGTTVHVSHNFEETLTMADRVAIMRDGRIVRVDPPGEIFRRPRTPFVAGFVRVENIFLGRGEGETTRLLAPWGSAAPSPEPAAGRPAVNITARGPVCVAFRADEVELLAPEAAPAVGVVRATRDLGHETLVEIDAQVPLVARTRRRAPAPGQRVGWGVSPEAVMLLETDEEPAANPDEAR